MSEVKTVNEEQEIREAMHSMIDDMVNSIIAESKKDSKDN